MHIGGKCWLAPALGGNDTGVGVGASFWLRACFTEVRSLEEDWAHM